MKAIKLRAAAKSETGNLLLPSVPVTIKASAEAEGQQGPPTFEAIAYSGGIIPRQAFSLKLSHDVVVNLKGMKPARKILSDLEHNHDHRVGHVPDYENDGTKVRVGGILSAATPSRDEVVNGWKDGYPWEVSQETAINTKHLRLLAAGKTEVVNGQTFTGPLYIADQSVFQRVAFVSEGADKGNALSIAATAAGEPKMNEFEQWLVANEIDPETLSDKAKLKLQASFNAEKAEKNGGGTTTLKSSLATIAEEERRENDRQDAIIRATHTMMKEHPRFISQIQEAGQKAIDDKLSVDAFELEMLRAFRSQAGTFKVRATQEPDEQVYEAALLRAAGMPNYEKLFDEPILDAVDRDPRLRNFSLQQFLLRAACSRGYDAAPGERITTGNIKRVLKYAFPDEDGPHMVRATQFSTISLPGVLGNAANKELRAGFEEEDNTWRTISRIVSATDFKTVTSYRLGDSLEYELLPKGGEIKHGELSEESYTRTLATYAKMLGLDRQDIINDDLSAFDDLRTRLGRGAARKFNNVFWAEFMNNASFFTAARGNYIEGATTNLGTDGVGLGLAQAEFGALQSADGKRIGGRATILLVPPESEIVADQLFTGGNPALQTVGNSNTFRNKYRPVVVPWLSDASFTGNSTTAFYLLRDAAILAAMVVAFLNGNQTPTVESTDADFNTLGILFRGFHDFSATKAEYLAGVKSKGAA